MLKTGITIIFEKCDRVSSVINIFWKIPSKIFTTASYSTFNTSAVIWYALGAYLLFSSPITFLIWWVVMVIHSASTLDDAFSKKLSAFPGQEYFAFKWILKWFSHILKTSFLWITLLLSLAFMTMCFSLDFFTRVQTALNRLSKQFLLKSTEICIISFYDNAFFLSRLLT